MPGTSLRPPAANIVRPGGDGRQVVVPQELPQRFQRGSVQVVPGDIGDDRWPSLPQAHAPGIGNISRNAANAANHDRKRMVR